MAVHDALDNDVHDPKSLVAGLDAMVRACLCLAMAALSAQQAAHRARGDEGSPAVSMRRV
jgi:hypothetical protein